MWRAVGSEGVAQRRMICASEDGTRVTFSFFQSKGEGRFAVAACYRGVVNHAVTLRCKLHDVPNIQSCSHPKRYVFL